MKYCYCSLAGTSACDHCTNKPSEWVMPVYVINPPFTVDTTKFPPQEFVPIVRCKDCKRCKIQSWHEIDRKVTLYYCKEYKVYKDSDDYCSFGERKEE